MRIALIQTTPQPGCPAANLEAMAEAVQQAANAGAQLALLPELADFGYDLAAAAAQAREQWPRTAAALGALAAETRMAIACGVARPTELGLTNALAVWGPDGRLGASYAKLHLFHAGATNETTVFTPGTALLAIETNDLRLGLAVCFDLRFPELFRSYRAAGCHGVLVAAAWPRARRPIWQALLVARAAESGLAVVGANHAGEAPFPLAGSSMAVAATGAVEALEDAPGILLTEVTAPTLPPGLDPWPRRREDLFSWAGPPVAVTAL